MEAEPFWEAAVLQAPRGRPLLEHRWFRSAETRVPEFASPSELAPRQDWGDAPDLPGFVGRAEELAAVRAWVLQDRCHLIGILGMGGIRKTRIATKLAKDVAPAFQRAYWQGLPNAPPPSEWLADAIRFLSGHQFVPPDGESKRLAALIQLLRDQPSLLVLDNFETLLEPGQRDGRYRDGFAAYGSLLQAIGETAHESCVVVTSREAPPELAVLDGHSVRSLRLGGLGVPEGQFLLADKQLSGDIEASRSSAENPA